MRAVLVGLLASLTAVVSCSSSSGPGFGSKSTFADASVGVVQGGDDAGNGASTGPSGNFGNNDGGPQLPDASVLLDGGFQCVMNASQYDIPGNGCDDDADGTIDNVLLCDKTLTASGTANDFMAAMGLCRVSADASHWGVVSATYTNGHTKTAAGPANFGQQHGILSAFGSKIVAREGYSLGVLSSGSATATDSDTGPAFKGIKGGMQGLGGGGGDVPSGFPKPAGTCPVSSAVNDVIDLKVQIRVPTNAKGFSFDFDFFTGEWPDFVCTNFNDAFIAYLQAKGFNNGVADNISFDSNGATISVNNNFFGVCTPGVTGCTGLPATGTVCALGPAELAGTGYDVQSPPQAYCGTKTSTSGGATSWLTSKAPVQPGEVITLEFLIWDTGDNSYDSSVLLDNFAWVPDPLPPTPITLPSPPPPPPPPPK